MESLYIHVPFCIRKCGYCDFFSVEYDESLVDRYLNSLEKEMQFYSEELRSLKTVYIGGGTPSALNEEALERLLYSLLTHVRLKESYEFTLEVNPVTLSGKKADIIRNYLIDRVSIGIQSFNDESLAALGRSHNSREAEDAIRIVSSSFDNYSIDLIYGIPGQDITEWKETVTRAISWGPTHISAYELTPERGTPLMSALDSGTVRLPEEDSILNMYESATDILSKEGYIHYEISNYAQKGFESKHNLNYWRRGEYIGLGPSAHSFINGRRYENAVNMTDYCLKLENGIAPFGDVVELSVVDELKEMIFLGLRAAEGIDFRTMIGKLNNATGRKVEYDNAVVGLMPFIDKELIEIGNDRLCITEKGFALSSTIIVEIMSLLGL